MDKLDEMIKEALTGEESDLKAEVDELGYFALGLNQFRGKLGWVTWVIMVVQSAMFVGGVYCAVRFFGVAEVLPALRWGLSAAVLFILATQLKLSLAPQMQADRVIRALRRVELLIVAGK